MIAAITTRITQSDTYFEIRDAISHDLTEILIDQNFVPFLIPNVSSIKKMYNKVNFDLLILSGGDDVISDLKNNCNALDNAKLLRTEVEMECIEFCIRKNIPIIGICRGMQSINLYFGGKLTLDKNNNHVNKMHHIELLTKKFFTIEKNKLLVNSYHNNVITKNNLGKQLYPVASANDNTVEALAHKEHSILGIMWHPERDFFNNYETLFFKKRFFKTIMKNFGEKI